MPIHILSPAVGGWHVCKAVTGSTVGRKQTGVKLARRLLGINSAALAAQSRTWYQHHRATGLSSDVVTRRSIYSCYICTGMRMGFDMRQQAMAAVQAKVLRLNSAAIADVTSGKVGYT